MVAALLHAPLFYPPCSAQAESWQLICGISMFVPGGLRLEVLGIVAVMLPADSETSA